MKIRLVIVLMATLAWLCGNVAQAASTAQDPAWRAWKQGLFERVYSTPRAVADEALQRLSGPAATNDLRTRLMATVELGMASHALSREAQMRARNWIEAGVAAARDAAPAHRDLLVDLLSLLVIDDIMLGRPGAAERLLQEADGLATGLPDAAQGWGLTLSRGIVSMARGDGAAAAEDFRQASDLAISPLQGAVTLIWQASVRRRFANPVRGMLNSSLQMLAEAQRLVGEGDFPVFRLMEIYTRIQIETTLGQFARAGAHTMEAAQVTSRLASQGHEYLEMSLPVVLAQFRQQDVLLAARLQSQRMPLLWGVGLLGALVCVAATLLLMRSLQKRRLVGLTGQLQQRNLELEDLTRSRARLLAAACHDLRQPAHALGLAAELALLARARGNTPENAEEVYRRVQSIKRNSVTLTDMLGELMDQTQLAGGSYEPEISAVVLEDLFHDVQHQFADLARRKGLSLHIDDSSLSVHSDRHLLRRICFNLVSNAVKYTEHGQVRVSATKAPVGKVRIVIEDTGPGIPRPLIPSVFEDYVRLNEGQAQEGLGIGLAIVKRAAELLGHPLDFESELGVGTTVTLTLDEALAEHDQGAAHPDALRPGAQQLIALLEDDAVSRQALTALLQQWGFDVVAATSADQLAQQIATGNHRRPDLLLTDLHLGELDGLEQAQRVLAWPGHETLPVLLVTGDLASSIAERAAALGIPCGYKPIVPRRLLALIQSALHSEQVDAAAP